MYNVFTIQVNTVFGVRYGSLGVFSALAAV